MEYRGPLLAPVEGDLPMGHITEASATYFANRLAERLSVSMNEARQMAGWYYKELAQCKNNVEIDVLSSNVAVAIRMRLPPAHVYSLQ